jgi:hypothetical protein
MSRTAFRSRSRRTKPPFFSSHTHLVALYATLWLWVRFKLPSAQFTAHWKPAAELQDRRFFITVALVAEWRTVAGSSPSCCLGSPPRGGATNVFASSASATRGVTFEAFVVLFQKVLIQHCTTVFADYISTTVATYLHDYFCGHVDKALEPFAASA